MLRLFSEGLTWQELWALLWPALAGAVLLFFGAVLVAGYFKQWFSGPWSPHWSRLAFGLTAAASSLPLFLTSQGRLETKAAELGVPILTLLLAIASQLGIPDDDGNGRRRRR